MAISTDRIFQIIGQEDEEDEKIQRGISSDRALEVFSQPKARTSQATIEEQKPVEEPKKSLWENIKTIPSKVSGFVKGVLEPQDTRATFEKAIQLYEQDTGQKVTQEQVDSLSKNLFDKQPVTYEVAQKSAEGYNNYLGLVLSDKYFKLGLEKEKDNPDQGKINKLEKEIKEVEYAIDDPVLSPLSLKHKETIASKYAGQRLTQSTIVGISTFAESLAGASEFVNRYMGEKSESWSNVEGLPEPFVKALDSFSARRKEKAEIANKVSTGVRKWALETMPTTASKGEKFGLPLASGVGSTVPYIITGYISAGLGLAAFGINTISESLSEAGMVYNDLREQGQSVDQAADNFAKVFLANVAVNAITNMFGFSKAIDNAMNKKVRAAGINKIIDAMERSGVISGGFEGLQEYYQYLVSEYGSDRVKNLDDLAKVVTSDEAKQEGLFGSIIGMATTAIINQVSELRTSNPELAKEAEDKVAKFMQKVEDNKGKLPTSEETKETPVGIITEEPTGSKEEGKEEEKKSKEKTTKQTSVEKNDYKDVELTYVRNKEKAPDMGERFGQNIEPAGKYISIIEPTQDFTPEGFERGTIKFSNPLVVKFGGEYGSETNWKSVLSKKFGGKVGVGLSKAIKGAGYDGIITTDEKGNISESVSLQEITPKPTKAETRRESITKRVGTRTVKFRENRILTPQNFKQIVEDNSGDAEIKYIKTDDFDFPNAVKDVKEGVRTFSKLPILIKEDAQGNDIVVDGNHRLAEAVERGDTKIRVMTDEKLYNELVEMEEQLRDRSTRDEKGRLTGSVSYDQKIKDYIKDRGKISKGNIDSKFRVREDMRKVGIAITPKQEVEIIKLNKKFFNDEDIRIVEQILANNKALGSYSEKMIKILSGQANPKDTFYHEAVHKYLDVFSTIDEQVDLFNAAIRKYGTEDLAKVEEKLAEDFIQYAKSREGITGKIRSVFDSVVSRIQIFLRNKDTINDFYAEIIKPIEEKKVVKKAPKKITKTAQKKVVRETKEVVIPKPVGRGKKKVSKLGVGVETKAIEAGLVRQFADLPEYNQVSIDSQINRAMKMVEEDFDRAVRIALGQEQPPYGLLPESVFKVVEDKATRDERVDLLRQLATSVRVGEATAMGQRIRILAERNPDSAVNKIRELTQARKEAIEKYKGTSVSRESAKIKKEVDNKVKEINKYDWKSFIDSIEC